MYIQINNVVLIFIAVADLPSEIYKTGIWQSNKLSSKKRYISFSKVKIY